MSERLLILLALITLQACTSVTIDEYKASPSVQIEQGERVVVLGRRHSANYETEPDLITCIAEVLGKDNDLIQVVSEREFVDALYPWFEPRTAPMRVRDMNRILTRAEVAERINGYDIRYIVWVDGNTETTSSSGSIGCSIGAGGAGCFGFGTWDKESDYEASIWDYQELESLGQISADAAGTSYMPAIVVPIPLIARVQKNACEAMGAQIKTFLNPQDIVIKQAGGSK
ncbi:hypothetical protein HBA55_09580 [Pseudomaricurvus alkylphenolicus]|jgi:hypothetical protein|uniref:hypothetical protein n=1 Tax=Pseudomaricurvus alkylphenolicus TaxID=1306991 RepID=UPI001422D57A|nr:hypothetical protein [Pseudomaricurvus alkylphenolicus]NIB39835.1 hypothetical protein [Pseudomaricurvus alkylphenolicus]